MHPSRNVRIWLLEEREGTSLAVQWLGLRAFTAGGTGSIPGQGTKIPHAMVRPKKKKKKIEERETDAESSKGIFVLCGPFHANPNTTFRRKVLL